MKLTHRIERVAVTLAALAALGAYAWWALRPVRVVHVENLTPGVVKAVTIRSTMGKVEIASLPAGHSR